MPRAALRSALPVGMIDSGQRERWTQDDLRWRDWMAAAQQGDKASYARLLHELRDVIVRFLTARLGPADCIEDITQDCLLSVHAGRHTYDVDRPFRAWLFTIVRHRTIDYLRRQRGPWLAPGTALAADDVASRDTIDAAGDAAAILGRLSPEQREIILLVKYWGFSAGEAAGRLGISSPSARVRLHRALSATRRLLDADFRDAT